MTHRLIIALLILMVLFIPIVPLKYTVKEPHTVRVPYQEWETKSETFINQVDYTLSPGYYVYWSKYLPKGRTVAFSAEANDAVDAYILSSSEYKNYKSGENFYPEASRTNSRNFKIVFTTEVDDTYYFIIKNPHTGFLGLFSKNVVIHSAKAEAVWQELVTKYREEISYIDTQKTTYLGILPYVLNAKDAASQAVLFFLVLLLVIPFTVLPLSKKSGQKSKLSPTQYNVPSVVHKEHQEKTELTKSRSSEAILKIPDFPSQLISKYEPLELLGKGGFAKVYKVKRKSDGKIIALKVPDLDEKAKKMIMKEIEAWKKLDHPNIVKLLGAYEYPIPHLELEFVEGVKVGEKIARDLGDYPKPVKEALAISFVEGIAKGLSHAHSKNVVHRDLKPQNVLLSNLIPKITDWGLAKIRAVSTTATIMKGLTLQYAAPEQIDRQTYGSTDNRTDLFQLGLIFYELLTGKLPYHSDSIVGTMAEILKVEPFPPPSSHKKELEKFDAILGKMLAKRKEERYQSVDEFLKDLAKLKEERFGDSDKLSLMETKTALLEEIKSIRGEISKSKDRKEIEKLKKNYVEKLCDLIVTNAMLGDKSETLKYLEELEQYTGEMKKEVRNAISQLEMMIEESIEISKESAEALKVLAMRVKKRYEG